MDVAHTDSALLIAIDIISTVCEISLYGDIYNKIAVEFVTML